jgi:cell division protein FtsW
MTPAAAPAGRSRGAAGRPRVLDRPLTSYYLVLGVSGILVGVGLVMVLSASSVTSYRTFGSSYTLFNRQAVWALVGAALLLAGSRLPARAWRLLAYPMLLASVALLLLVFMPGLGVEVNGNQNWVYFGGPFRLQPSEAAKLAILLWGADLLTRKERLLVQWKHLIVPLVPVAAVVIALVLMGGDLGTGLVLIGVVGALLFFAGAPLRLFGGLLAVAVLLVTWLAMSAEYRVDRLESWLNPFADYRNSGWQAARGIFALATGGWWGLGLGASREKWGTLPAAHTDFIFAVIGEELGLLGSIGVLVLFLTLGYAGFRIASRSSDGFVRLAAAAATFWLVLQATMNIGAVLGLVPITGITLPLVSYGGSSLLPTMLALGMLLSFARAEPGAQAALLAQRRGWLAALRRGWPARRGGPKQRGQQGQQGKPGHQRRPGGQGLYGQGWQRQEG